MDKVREKVLKTDFTKFFKSFFILAILVMILGGIGIGITFHTQISETFNALQKGEFHFGEMEKPYYGEYGEEAGLSLFSDITRPSAGAVTVVLLYGGIAMILLLLFWIAVAACLYQRGIRSGMNGFLWLLCGLAGNLLAIPAFLLVRSLTRQKCHICGHWQVKKRWYCTECGAEINRNCSECGELCEIHDKYCSRCGREL